MNNMLCFSYGTLKRGLSNHFMLASAEFVANARTKNLYGLYDQGRFPGMVYEEFSTQVHGELYRIDKRTLADLDKLERHPLLYQRYQIQVFDDSFNLYSEVWAYFIRAPHYNNWKKITHSWPPKPQHPFASTPSQENTTPAVSEPLEIRSSASVKPTTLPRAAKVATTSPAKDVALTQ